VPLHKRYSHSLLFGIKKSSRVQIAGGMRLFKHHTLPVPTIDEHEQSSRSGSTSTHCKPTASLRL
jgi:hypothetical protein